MDLISVIMPAYNSERFIAESIESVIAQTFTNWELIVVDDGSTDNTAKIVKGFSSIDSRIKYFYQPNQQMGKARNTGLQNSNGKLIAFLDSDDIWVSDKLKIQVDFLQNKEVDLVFSDGYVISNSIDNVEYEYKTINDEIYGRYAQHKLMMQNFIPIPSVLTYKSAIDQVGGFNENIEIHNVADYHLWLKMLIGGFKFYGISDKLFYYRRHDSQSTYTDPYSFEAVLIMYENQLQVPKEMKKELNRIKLIWAGNWYRAYAANNETAKIVLDRMSGFTYIRTYTKIIRIFIMILGVRISRKVVNRISLFLSKTLSMNVN